MDKLKSAAVAVQTWVMEHKKFTGAVALVLFGYALGKVL